MAGTKVYALDMGKLMYGDCLVVEVGGKTILVDGGHKKDFEGQPGCKSIPQQLTDLGYPNPFKPDLLIVTHCHADHIGCLPEMVANDSLKPKWALVADENLGFGGGGGQDDVKSQVDAAPMTVRKVVAALREEDVSHLDNNALEAFIDEVVTLEDRYRAMLKKLKKDGTRIVRYGKNDTKALIAAIGAKNLTILGPTTKHLKICAKAIKDFMKDSVDVARTFDQDDQVPASTLYRALARRGGTDAQDRPGLGAALNDQSIICVAGSGKSRVLLTGDMQFAKAEISGLGPEMTALRAKVQKAAPFEAGKLSHHASYNGFDQSVMAEWKTTRKFFMTGGLNDPGHPDAGVLKLLKANKSTIQWARTDRNGLITITANNGQATLKPSKGKLNNGAPNGGDVSGEVTVITEAAGAAARRARVVITIEVDPESSVNIITHRTDSGATVSDGPLRLGGGRTLPKLLFVTNKALLAKSVGAQAAERVAACITAAGQELFDLNAHGNKTPVQQAKATAKQLKDHKGVVIVGGYDVVPPISLDVLDKPLRDKLKKAGSIEDDADMFVVWSDAPYSDKDGDSLSEVPVSRVPDGNSAEFLYRAIQADQPAKGHRFGIRNDARPFAEAVFNDLDGAEEVLVSRTTSSSSIPQGSLKADAIYLMLHGSDSDATRFWGEDDGDMLEAINVRNLVDRHPSVVFTGCCWGALAGEPPAVARADGQPFATRTAANSMALKFLDAGAVAFIGCTGSHYSPVEPPYNHAGGPLHKAFWKHYKAGKAPALALYEAKKEYATGIPHGRTGALNRAKEMKIVRQFTCLGLGW